MDNWGITKIAVQEVPEPSSADFLGLGGLALLMRRRKQDPSGTFVMSPPFLFVLEFIG